MTRYLERALFGATTNREEWNEHLTAFHAAFPCSTPGMIAQLANESGENPYTAFARYIQRQAPKAASVLDVGCGSGDLLAQLRDVYGAKLSLSGIDLSETDATHARARNPDADIECADAAQPLRGRVDLVVAHLTLRSVAALRAVLQNMYDVLNDDGSLVFAVEDVEAADTIVSFIRAIFGSLQERFPNAAVLSVPAREPFETVDMMRSLLESVGFSAVSIESTVFTTRLSPADVVQFALMSYPFALLEGTVKEELAEIALRIAQSQAGGDGTVLVNFPVKYVTALAGRHPIPPAQRSEHA